MMKKISMAVFSSFLVASGAYASEPIMLSEAQMDSVTAAGFVCPVFNAAAVGAHNPNAVQIAGGDYSIIGPTVNVPMHATNDNGAGNPMGDHVAPGNTDYTAIWY